MARYLETIALLAGAALLGSSSILIWRQESLPPHSPAQEENRGPANPADPLPPVEVDIEILRGNFRGTVYYTPRESGFRAEEGFDLTPSTAPGLSGRKFPRDFLRAVRIEGFGRMRQPVDGLHYLRYCGGQWSFAREPVDRRGRPLQAMRSAAVADRTTALPMQTIFRVTADELPARFRDAQWEVCDTGSGLKPDQVDFYWGEDDPLGPGARLTRPRGLPKPVGSPLIMVLR